MKALNINYPSLREMLLNKISSKYEGNIPTEALRDNDLTNRLVNIRNMEIDLPEGTLLEEVLKDRYTQELLTK